MSQLRPVPLSLLIRQGAKSYDRDRTVFGIHRRAMYRGVPGCDMRRAVGRGEIGAPLGIASGPHTQMAQNIAAGYLAGARLFELKSLKSEPYTPERPTIFPGEALRHHEWTHELGARDAFFEFAKGMYLIEALRALFIPENLTMGLEGYAFDLSLFPEPEPISIGDGILQDRAGDMEPVWDVLRHDLRAELPRDLLFLAEIPLPESLTGSITLSLDHAPRFEDVTRVTDEWRDAGFTVRWKLPPEILGAARVETLLAGLGYDEWRVLVDEGGTGRSARADVWHDRLSTAGEQGTQLSIGHGPRVARSGEAPGYLSGRPLFPFSLAIAIMLQQFGYKPADIIFAGGIDETNYPEAVGLGFNGVTLCSDLFRPGGLGRLGRLHRALGREMRSIGAGTIESYREKLSPPRSLEDALVRSLGDDRYHRRLPQRRDITSALALFDCVNCDLCMPVCPNGANFTYMAEPESVERGRFRWANGTWDKIESRTVAIGDGKRPRQQIGSEAELCNDCGLCEAVCPENGAPQFEKARIFRSRASFERDPRNGFLIGRDAEGAYMLARFDDGDFELRVGNGNDRFRAGDSHCLVTEEGLPMGAPDADSRDGDEVDLATWQRMRWILDAFLQREATSLAAVSLEEDVW